MSHEDGFSKGKTFNIQNASYSICDDYGANANQIWMNEDWFYMTDYDDFDSAGIATSRYLWQTYTMDEILQRKILKKISRSVRTYVYLFLTSKAKVRSSTVSNPESKLGDQ